MTYYRHMGSHKAGMLHKAALVAIGIFRELHSSSIANILVLGYVTQAWIDCPSNILSFGAAVNKTCPSKQPVTN